MTTVFCDKSACPRMHALVAGVGSYPYLKGGAPPSTDWPWRNLGQLTCPPKSAESVGRWLLRNQITDPVTPLGSLEMVASPSLQLITGQDDESSVEVDVEAGTFEHFRESLDRWFDRCDANTGNVGFFYFSGHGIQTDTLALLLEDVGKDRRRFFDQAFDFDNLYEGMASLKAGIQCYFVDACRSQPDTEEWQKVQPRKLMHFGSKQQIYRDAPIIFSAAEGQEAYGTPGESTEFTKALLTALGGRGTANPRAGSWQVTTHSIGYAIGQLMERDSHERARYQPLGEARGGAIRTLRDVPIVPFRLGWRPEEALAVADMQLVDLTSGHIKKARDIPECRIWEGEIHADKYNFRATFGGKFHNHADPIWMLPPHVDQYFHAEPT